MAIPSYIIANTQNFSKQIEVLTLSIGEDRKIDATFFANAKARTPWSIICVPASGYTYSSSYHWKVCSDCGEIVTSKSSHSFKQYSTYKQCKVCGYKTTDLSMAD